jgi:hypothetical protein
MNANMKNIEQVKKKHAHLWIIIVILILIATISVLSYAYLKPERYVISCSGNQTQGFMYPYIVGGKMSYSQEMPQTAKQVIKKYFWGIKYSLNDFEMQDCTLENNTIFCNNHDSVNNETNEEYFNLDKNYFHSYFKTIWKDEKSNQTNYTEVVFGSTECKKINVEQF